MLPTGPETYRARQVFLNTVFDDSDRGWICLAISSPLNATKTFAERWFLWPEEEEQLLSWVDENVLKGNIYFCPMLFSSKKRTKSNVVSTRVAWADLDRCVPGYLHVPPTISIQSSPDRFQAYWRFETKTDPFEAEALSKRIAYKHADQGCDRSGWDLTQLLRFPYTYNFKYDEKVVDAPMVQILDVERSRFRMADFNEHYPDTGDLSSSEVLPFPDLSDYEGMDGEALLQSKRIGLNPRIWPLFTEVPEGSWSEPLWNLLMLLMEGGFSREECFLIARDAKCNKFGRDGKDEELLWRDVCRAWGKNEFNFKILTEGVKDDPDSPLLSDEERERIKGQTTFIERYQEWARTLGDAAPQYHQAGAFIALSGLLAGAIRLPTSFGTISPNLWFLIAADTTLTRKSTAMDIAMDMVNEVDPNAVLATDGSLEGLLTGLSTRPGVPSIFLRDEFSGLLESMTKKDYMSGMPELLTKLYDGKMQKRMLRKEVIEVRDPCLIIFAGGIKERMQQLLSFEQVSSGFIPRFVFITAESDVSRLKPLGPPTGQTLSNGEAIQKELLEIYNHYRTFVKIEIGDKGNVAEMPKKWDCRLTPDAWVRYNKLESQLMDSGLKAERPDLMTPIYDRLSKSILKAAMLLSASRQRGEEDILITEDDILRAIMYGEQWRVHAREMVTGIGKGTFEKQLDAVYRQISRSPGVGRSTVMQYHHLTARSANEIFETLRQRGLITTQKAGRSERLFPVQSLIGEEE